MTIELSDRDRWNRRYQDGAEGGTPLMLGRNLHLFPRSGNALEVAGGPGQAAVVLAARGLSVTLADVSDVALAMANERAERSGVALTTRQVDLSAEPLPAGPWDLITSFNFLDRQLVPQMIKQLALGGHLALSIATKSNLQRHERPNARFLLDDGELPSLVAGLGIILYSEGWGLDGRHTAELFAQKV